MLVTSVTARVLTGMERYNMNCNLLNVRWSPLYDNIWFLDVSLLASDTFLLYEGGNLAV